MDAAIQPETWRDKEIKNTLQVFEMFSTESDARTPSWNSTYEGSNFVVMGQLELFTSKSSTPYSLERIIQQSRIIPIFETFFGQEMPTVPL